MKILGIDPGLTRLGFGLIESSGNRVVQLLDVGVFRSNPEAAIEKRIGLLAELVEGFIEKQKPDSIAIERIFAQSNLKSVIGIAQISGVVLSLAHRFGIPIGFYTPSEVKLAVTGSGRADKAQVGFMVAKILKLPEVPKPADAADSLAIAICAAWKPQNASAAISQTKAQEAWLSALAKSKSTKG